MFCFAIIIASHLLVFPSSLSLRTSGSSSFWFPLIGIRMCLLSQGARSVSIPTLPPSAGKKGESKLEERGETRVGTCYDTRCRSNRDRLDKNVGLFARIKGSVGRVSSKGGGEGRCNGKRCELAICQCHSAIACVLTFVLNPFDSYVVPRSQRPTCLCCEACW